LKIDFKTQIEKRRSQKDYFIIIHLNAHEALITKINEIKREIKVFRSI
jgi:hypothetical protein